MLHLRVCAIAYPTSVCIMTLYSQSIEFQLAVVGQNILLMLKNDCECSIC